MVSSGQTVLVVDDDDTIRQLVERFLRASGHGVVAAASGAQALALLREQHVDLVMLDLMMPVMSGSEVLQQLKSDDALHDIPVIVISADSDMTHIVRCLRLGAEDYLVKPFNMVFFEARVGACLERQRLRAREQAYMLELEARVSERTALAEQRATDLERSEALLRRQSAILQSILHSMGEGVVVVDLAGRLVHHNPAASAILGAHFEALLPGAKNMGARYYLQDQVTPCDPTDLPLAQAIGGRAIDGMELYIMPPDNARGRWLNVTARPLAEPGGGVGGAVAVVRDVSDRKEFEQQLLHDALHDGLTGLANRALFVNRLSHALARKTRNADYSFAILFLDLDRFKVINDSLGHSIGDELLMTVARRIESCLRPVDTVARLGGDEFTVLVEDVASKETALLVAERILASLVVPLQLGKHDVFTTGSIGVVMSDERYSTPAEMIRDADTAMYQAKMAGKSRVILFDPAMRDLAVTQLQLESDLRRALERHELRVHYQPIVALESGQIVGLEALVRWEHPQRGLLYPSDFFGIAEETGLIVPISWWVLGEACRQMRAWQLTLPAAAGLWLTVNLAEKQLAQPDIAARLAQILDETGLPPYSLRLEITERALITNPELTARGLAAMRATGIQICIDDFGTGYSSLNYLQHFQVDVLKIDRSFIGRIGEHDEPNEIVRTIIALARALSLQAVAEGTETMWQVTQLRQLQCEYGQGWLFSKAIDADGIAALIRAEQGLL